MSSWQWCYILEAYNGECRDSVAYSIWSSCSMVWCNTSSSHNYYTWCLTSIMIIDSGSRIGCIAYIWTLLLGLYFIALQAREYIASSFSVSDRIYGSIFYIGTGFHGLHVIAGIILLRLIGCKRWSSSILYYSSSSIIGIRCSIWYWHLVDGVWLILFSCIYWWGL